MFTKKPISRSSSGRVPPGDRHANAHVALARITSQQHLKRRQQHHAQRAIFFGSQAAQIVDDRSSKAGAGTVWPRYVCTAGRGRSSGKASGPGRSANCVRQYSLSAAATGPVPSSRWAIAYSANCTGSGASSHAPPPVSACVLLCATSCRSTAIDQPSQMIWCNVSNRTCSLRQPYQSGSYEWTTRQVERANRLGIRRPGKRLITCGRVERRKVFLGQLKLDLLANDLFRTARGTAKHGPQRLMPCDHRVKRRRKQAGFQVAHDARRNRDIVKRVARLELIEKPQPFLAERQGSRLAGVAARRRGHTRLCVTWPAQ